MNNQWKVLDRDLEKGTRKELNHFFIEIDKEIAKRIFMQVDVYGIDYRGDDALVSSEECLDNFETFAIEK